MNLLINNKINQKFNWLNEPEYSIEGETIRFKTNPETDFWQKTHYGFERDNGHCLLTNVNSDFSMTVKTRFFPTKQYDQCGLFVRIDKDNWIKTSTEYEDSHHSRLGSVVTNLGYSDWATLDINTPITEMWYSIKSKNNLSDFLILYSENGILWKQLRITHLLLQDKVEIEVGIYACSPKQGSFDVAFEAFQLTASDWS